MLMDRKYRKVVLKSDLTLSFMEESFKAAVFQDHIRTIGLIHLDYQETTLTTIPKHQSQHIKD